MSPQDESNSEGLPASRSSSADNLAAVAPLPRRITPPNEILFLDNTQDARSMRSTIQRHAAYHAAAQRREARLQSSRERTYVLTISFGSVTHSGRLTTPGRPLNLEWQRRPSLETSVSTPSYVSPLDTLAQTTPGITEPARPDRSSTDVEEAGANSNRRRHSAEAYQNSDIAPVESLEPPVSSPVLRNIGADEVGRRVLDAYQLAIRAQSLSQRNPQHWEARERSLEQVNLSLGVLRQRLASEHEGYSDRTIQAVLMLYVYASRFQTRDEATSHRTALERMIGLRGGLNSFGHNLILAQQLERFASRDDVHQILRTTYEPGPRS